MACSLPGSSVHGILQARILQWLANPPPGDLSDLGNLYLLVSPTLQMDSLLTEPLGARLQDREWKLKVNSEKPKSKIRHRLKFGREDRESIIEGFLNIA